MDDLQNQEVEVDVAVDTVESPQVSDADALMSVENMINATLERIDALTKEASKLNEMLTSVLENDEVYNSQNEAVKEATKVRNATKSEMVLLGGASAVIAYTVGTFFRG